MTAPRKSIVLASASTSRLRLLHSAGIEPTVMRSRVDEDVVTDEFWRSQPPGSIAELASALARAKGIDVIAELADGLAESIVVGCDSVLEWNGEALGKPGSAQAATDRLRQLNGTEGVLHTGHFVYDGETKRSAIATESTTVRFAPMSDDEIDAYVRTGEPIHVAGSFTLDGLSGPFIDGIVGDPSNVIGLSLPLLRRMLADLGVSWLHVVGYS